MVGLVAVVVEVVDQEKLWRGVGEIVVSVMCFLNV